MRGYPPLEAAAAALLILLLALPVAALTSGRMPTSPSGRSTVESVPRREEKVMLEVICTSPPEKWQVSWAGKPPGKTPQPKAVLFLHAMYTLPPSAVDGVDLVFEARWPRSVPVAACRFRLLGEDRQVLAERTVWSENGSFDGVVKLP